MELGIDIGTSAVKAFLTDEPLVVGRGHAPVPLRQGAARIAVGLADPEKKSNEALRALRSACDDLGLDRKQVERLFRANAERVLGQTLVNQGENA